MQLMQIDGHQQSCLYDVMQLHMSGRLAYTGQSLRLHEPPLK